MIFKFCFKNRQSKSIALDRLKVLLISDRVDCNPDIMDMLKEDMAKVISKYLEIDTDSINIEIKKNPRDKSTYQARLCANVPVKSVSGGAGIKA